MEPLATARRLELRISEALEMETRRLDGPDLPSLRRTKLWKTVQRNSRFRFPGGETFVDAEARVLDEIEHPGASPRGRVAIGTHGDLVRCSSRTTPARISTSSSA